MTGGFGMTYREIICPACGKQVGNWETMVSKGGELYHQECSSLSENHRTGEK